MHEHDGDHMEPGAEFDRLLRSSLETYADPGPDSGLAERVLARIAAEGRGGRARRMNPWAIALPVAACLIIVIALLASKFAHHSADEANQVRVTLPKSTGGGARESIANSPSVPARREVISRPRRHSSYAAVSVTAKRLPKLDVFPATQPLTAAETKFVAYVAHASEAERQSLVETQQQLAAPLMIAALEIQPLEPPEPQGN